MTTRLDLGREPFSDVPVVSSGFRVDEPVDGDAKTTAVTRSRSLVKPRTHPTLDRTEACADEIERADSVTLECAEQVLLDEFRGVAWLLDAEPIEDVLAIGDRIAA